MDFLIDCWSIWEAKIDQKSIQKQSKKLSKSRCKLAWILDGLRWGQDEAKMSQDEAKIGQDAAKMAKIEPYGGTLEPTWSEDRAKICRFPPKEGHGTH